MIKSSVDGGAHAGENGTFADFGSVITGAPVSCLDFTEYSIRTNR
ncbi:hypothetical protein QN379_17635 [Glaciimonas sp. Gout2]|nr:MULTISPECIES: hypothetical protein [unclassified Glaciimonas]MDY7548738.1 hypothetical protein [Glaciimonas sp. CA11.2]MEB0013898.1 hypothetical protein [Glaciimonas sp. Cout2]MEB0083833.1 hypothetical protein [Glaciimonas sp. Gout2]